MDLTDETILLTEKQIARKVAQLAKRVARAIDDETVCVCVLTGGIWFTADLTRELHKLGCDPLFDALWLASYGDERSTSGRIETRAGLQRDVRGRKVLLIDDVFDSGLSLAKAARICREAGAAEVLTCVFALKPWDGPRPPEPDFAAWNAPAEFLIGYGMDEAGHGRGRGDITTAS
jgi:hypoxanthine phosphoribosyltransferase